MPLKEGRFSGLPGGEDEDVFSIFDEFYEISDFLRTPDDIVIMGVDRSLCSESSHRFLLLVEALVSLVYQRVSGVSRKCFTGYSDDKTTTPTGAAGVPQTQTNAIPPAPSVAIRPPHPLKRLQSLLLENATVPIP